MHYYIALVAVLNLVLVIKVISHFFVPALYVGDIPSIQLNTTTLHQVCIKALYGKSLLSLISLL